MYLALLRGINVGGKNKLPMKDLVDLFVAEGCTNVRTYIQSGNVLFRADPDLAAIVADRASRRIYERFGFQVPVVLRSTEQLRGVVSNNPFLTEGAPSVNDESLHVMFLADEPDPRLVASLDPLRSPPDAFVVRGPEIFLQLPNGMARTKLTNAYFDARLRTVCTARNWRTVTTLLGMLDSSPV